MSIPVTELPAPGATAPFEAVIAGGGLAGYATALALAESFGSSARIALVTRERHEAGKPSGDGRALALSAASVRLLEHLGAWSPCVDACQPVTTIEVTDSRLDAGIRPVLLTYENLLGSGEAASWIAPVATLEAALWARVAATPAVTVFPAETVTAFAASPATIAVTLASGRTLTASVLIAADGRRSPLRALAGIKTVGWSYGQTGITVAVRHDRPHGGRAVQHFLPGGPFALLPLPGNRTCITWSERAGEAARLMALSDEAFLVELDRRAGGFLGAIELDGPRQSWPLDMFLSRAFVADRFALVGDAAHGVHPIAGQGLNLGLKDVAALAETLADARAVGFDIGHGTVLAKYERWRRFDTMSSATAYDALNRLFSTDGTLRRSLREFGLGIVDRLPGLKTRLVAEAAGTSGELPRLMRAGS